MPPMQFNNHAKWNGHIGFAGEGGDREAWVLGVDDPTCDTKGDEEGWAPEGGECPGDAEPLSLRPLTVLSRSQLRKRG